MNVWGCLVVRPDCSLLAKYINAPGTEASLDLKTIVRVAVAVSDLSQDDGEAFLQIRSISVAVAPGHEFLALVLGSHDTDRIDLVLRARQVGHWFQLLRKHDEADCFETSPLDYDNDMYVSEDSRFCRPWLAGVINCFPYRQIWMEPLKEIPNLVVGAMLDFTLGSSPSLIVHKEGGGNSEDWNRYKWLPKWCTLWEAIATECKYLAHGRQARRIARRGCRKSGVQSQDSQSAPKGTTRKVNQAHMTLLQAVVHVYIKLVRLPEHDPCIVAVCCDNASALHKGMDAFEAMLPSNLGSREAYAVNHSDQKFCAEVQSAFLNSSQQMKHCFPKVNSLGLTGCQCLDDNSPQPILYPTPPSEAKESTSPRASMQQMNLLCSSQKNNEDVFPKGDKGQLENSFDAEDARDTDSCLGSVDVLFRELCTEEDL